MVWIPVGFGHGFAALTETVALSYKVTEYYSPKAERAVLWNDPELGIDWKVSRGRGDSYRRRIKLGCHLRRLRFSRLMPRVLLLGAGGQLGMQLAALAGQEGSRTDRADRAELDLSNADAIARGDSRLSRRL
jgi:hypothetical protein